MSIYFIGDTVTFKYGDKFLSGIIESIHIYSNKETQYCIRTTDNNKILNIKHNDIINGSN